MMKQSQDLNKKKVSDVQSPDYVEMIRHCTLSTPPDALDQEHGSAADSMASPDCLPKQISSVCAWQQGLKGTISAGRGRGFGVGSSTLNMRNRNTTFQLRTCFTNVSSVSA